VKTVLAALLGFLSGGFLALQVRVPAAPTVNFPPASVNHPNTSYLGGTPLQVWECTIGLATRATIAAPEHKRIDSISLNDPAVLRLKAYAKSHNLLWEISPEGNDGDDYCGTLAAKTGLDNEEGVFF
jgi:hypothetical protein